MSRNPRKKIRPKKYLQDLFDLAGSSTKLAANLDLHVNTVERWRRTGIPLKHWDNICDSYNITPAELYLISRQCQEAAR